MDTLIIGEIIKAIGDGNIPKGLFLILVFALIWWEVKAMKRQFTKLNETISDSFAKGEVRFKNIEDDIHSIKLDLDTLKPHKNPGG